MVYFDANVPVIFRSVHSVTISCKVCNPELVLNYHIPHVKCRSEAAVQRRRISIAASKPDR